MSDNYKNVEKGNETEEKESTNKNENQDEEAFEEGKSLKTSTEKNYNEENQNNNVKISNDYNKNNNLQSNFEYFIVPKDLIKTLTIILFILMSGILLIALGVIKLTTEWEQLSGKIMFVFGCIILISSGYFIFKFYKAKVAKFDYERNEILNSIPRL